MSDSAADSLYRTDVRVLQHILFGARQRAAAGQGGHPEEGGGDARPGSEGRRLRPLASELSEDPGSKSDSGFLPPSPKGQFVASFDSAAWALQPGQTSGVVETPFGFHLSGGRRWARCAGDSTITSSSGPAPRWTRPSWTAWRRPTRSRSRTTPRRPCRSALGAAEESRRSGQTIANYKGGKLTVQEFLRWVRALPPQYLQQLKAADDSTLIRFARVLTQNTLLLREADAANIRPTELEWKTMERQYLSQLDTLKTEMGLTGADLTDSTASAGERKRSPASRWSSTSTS